MASFSAQLFVPACEAAVDHARHTHGELCVVLPPPDFVLPLRSLQTKQMLGRNRRRQRNVRRIGGIGLLAFSASWVYVVVKYFVRSHQELVRKRPSCFFSASHLQKLVVDHEAFRPSARGRVCVLVPHGGHACSLLGCVFVLEGCCSQRRRAPWRLTCWPQSALPRDVLP